MQKRLRRSPSSVQGAGPPPDPTRYGGQTRGTACSLPSPNPRSNPMPAGSKTVKTKSVGLAVHAVEGGDNRPVKLESPIFTNGDEIPDAYTDYGDGVSPPPRRFRRRGTWRRSNSASLGDEGSRTREGRAGGHVRSDHSLSGRPITSVRTSAAVPAWPNSACGAAPPADSCLLD